MEPKVGFTLNRMWADSEPDITQKTSRSNQGTRTLDCPAKASKNGNGAYVKAVAILNRMQPVHDVPEATLQQNLQDRDFPSRRVRKKPPKADVQM